MDLSEKSVMLDICRLCGKEEAFILPIFSKAGKDKHHIANKIEICLPKLKISPSDELSKVICYKCMFILEQCSDFCTRVTNVNEVMKRQYSTNARPCSSDSSLPPRKRIKTVTADKGGNFPRQSVSLDWESMGDDIIAIGSSESSDDSLSRRTSAINIRTHQMLFSCSTPAPQNSKITQHKVTLGEESTKTNYHKEKQKSRGWESSEESEAVTPPLTTNNLKRNQRELNRKTVEKNKHTKISTNSSFDVKKKTIPKNKGLKTGDETKTNYLKGKKINRGWGSSEESATTTPPLTTNNLKRNQRELNRKTVEQDKHSKISTNSSLNVKKKPIPLDKELKAMFESKWINDPQFLPSSERETDCESDTNRSWSSSRTTMSEMFGKAPRKKDTPKPSEQQVPKSRCVTSMRDTAMKRTPSTLGKRSCPGSNTDSDTCSGLTPELGPEWCRNE